MSFKMFTKSSLVAATGLLAAGFATTASAADLDVLKVSGYIRHAIEFTMQDPNAGITAPGTNVSNTDPRTGQALADRAGSMDMSRTTVRFDLEAELPTVTFVAIARATREINTNSMQELDRVRLHNNQNLAIGGGGKPTDLTDQYNRTQLREFYADFNVTDRVSMRLGKQQVAFGEADFFQGSDLLHGFDWTWRSFLEAENEELRKPMTMINTTIQVPELSGKLQLIYRPFNIDEKNVVGKELDIFGGRYSGAGTTGIDFLSIGIAPYNYHHPKGDSNRDIYALRWSGFAADVNYSLIFMRHFDQDPIVLGNPGILSGAIPGFVQGLLGANDAARMRESNIAFDGRTCSNFVPGSTATATASCFAEVVYPFVTTFGATGSYYEAWSDAVYSAEWTFTKDKAYQFGRDGCAFCQLIPGFVGLAGAKKQDTMKMMIRGDKLLYLSDYIGTHRASFFTVQAFNQFIPGFEKSQQLVVGPGFGQRVKQWDSVVTMILALNYLNDRINPTLVAGYDIGYPGMFIIPSVNLVQGDSWRLLLEADIFLLQRGKTTQQALLDGGLKPDHGASQTNIFGSFKNNDKLYIRLTRQF